MKIKLKYGEEGMSIDMDNAADAVFIDSNEALKKSEEEVIMHSLENPIDSPRLCDVVKDDRSVCIVVSDTTRAWQKISTYLPYVIDEINRYGQKDIKILCATGTHRKQTENEHRILVGDAVYEKYGVIDHDCHDNENLKYVGTTSFGTPIYINKIALDCDRIVLTGGIVFHDMAGFGGGRKSIVPGISGYDTIMKNHSLSLNVGKLGINPEVGCASLEHNPFSLDIEEACEMVKPDFIFNVLMSSEGDIDYAVSGNFKTAHRKGCAHLMKTDGVKIKDKAECVIVSAGGYPKDIDLYQASKALSNAKEAAVDGGTIILFAKCIEGIGNDDVLHIITDYATNEDREKELRRQFTVAKFTGYLICDIAERFKLYIISDLDEEDFKHSSIHTAKDFESLVNKYALDMHKYKSIYVMPNGASTLPIIER